MDDSFKRLCDSQYNLGIKHVFDAFQEEIDENWSGDFRANAQYLVDKVKWQFEDYLPTEEYPIKFKETWR